MATIKERLLSAIVGEKVEEPVYLVYDAFTKNPKVDWQSLYDMGLGIINHVKLVDVKYPNMEIVESHSEQDGLRRRDVTYKTDKGELHEYFLGDVGKGFLPWREESLIKTREDYRIMFRALEEAEFFPTNADYDQSEEELAGRGISIGSMERSPIQKIQIDYVGLERFSFDFADRLPELLDLHALMREQIKEMFKAAVKTKAMELKIWENMSIEILGPKVFKEFLVPVYEDIFAILEGSDKRLYPHYDGKLGLIKEDLKHIPFHGIDSLTPPPEGDLSIAEARKAWPDLFFWVHPTMDWFCRPVEELKFQIKEMTRAAGPYKYCLEISEDIPPRLGRDCSCCSRSSPGTCKNSYFSKLW